MGANLGVSGGAVGAGVWVLSGATAGMAVGEAVAAGAAVGFGVEVAVEPQAANASNSSAAATVLKIMGCFANFIYRISEMSCSPRRRHILAIFLNLVYTTRGYYCAQHIPPWTGPVTGQLNYRV